MVNLSTLLANPLIYLLYLKLDKHPNILAKIKLKAKILPVCIRIDIYLQLYSYQKLPT